MRTETRAVEGPWVTRVEVGGTAVDVPAVRKEMPNLENFPGRNVLVELDIRNLVRRPQPGERVRFALQVELEDGGFQRFWHQYSGGSISVLTFLAGSEQRFLGLGKRRMGSLDLPGTFLNLLKTRDRVERVEYSWLPQLAGEFVSPETMIGAKQYWSDGRERTEGRFVFKTVGASRFSWLAAAWFSIMAGGFTLAWRTWAAIRPIIRGRHPPGDPPRTRGRRRRP